MNTHTERIRREIASVEEVLAQPCVVKTRDLSKPSGEAPPMVAKSLNRTKYEIVKLPIPPLRTSIYPFDLLEVGFSFIVHDKGIKTVRSACHKFNFLLKKQFRCAQLTDGTIHVWREK